jgi:hypothetical protein
VKSLVKVTMKAGPRRSLHKVIRSLAFTCPTHGNPVLGVYMSVLWIRTTVDADRPNADLDSTFHPDACQDFDFFI